MKTTAPKPRVRRRASSSRAGGLHKITLQLQREQIRALRERVAALETEVRSQIVEKGDLSDGHPIPCIELLANGIIISASPSAVKFLGGGKVIYEHFRTFIAPEDITPFYRHLHQCLLEGPPGLRIETAVSLKSGDRSRPVRLVSDRVPKPRPGQSCTVPTALVDMTEFTAAAQWRALQDQNFQRLVESIDAIVWQADLPFKLRFISPQVEALLGYPANEWLRDPGFWFMRIHIEDRDRVLHEREAAIRAGAPHVTEYRFHSADRKVLWLRDSMVISRSPQGHAQLHGLSVNITPLKEAEAELRRANDRLAAQAADHRRHLEQTVDSMETFCYGIAHELRAPVRAMQGFSELLLNEPESADRADYLQRIATAAARLDKLISDLLAYGRLHHTDVLLTPSSVAAIVDRVLDVLSQEISKRGGVVEVQPTEARVMAHPMLLGQALRNLISNGLKFVPDGVRPRVQIQTQLRGQWVRIAVCDNGVGVDPEYRAKIFGLFQRAHSQGEYPGTGIGLAMVKRIVELLNGRFGVESATVSNSGSCFWIELPTASLPG